jgi:hypothetical protein
MERYKAIIVRAEVKVELYFLEVSAKLFIKMSEQFGEFFSTVK